MRGLACLLAVTGLVFAQSRAPERSHGRSMVISTRGIVATSQVLASQAGAMVLAKGGSAVDAAIAANAVLGLVEPMMCGIGGDLFVMYREAKTGQVVGLNASGAAPRGMTVEALRAKGLKEMARTGIHSATVPGCVRGWEAMHKRYGKLAWRELFSAAVRFAEEGFPVHEMTSVYWENAALRKDAESARVFYPQGRAVRTGEMFRNPDLARAMRSIAEGGADSFYKGEVARAILAASAKRGGLMTASDLAAFEPEWVTPVSTDYRGWKVYELPPNGQGLAALTMLNILETFPPGAYHSAAELHRKIEAMKLAYADLRYVADPLMVRVPVAGLISKEYARERAGRIDAAKANCEVKAGSPPGGSSDTTYFSVVDREGNIASWIQSISGAWGAAVTVEGMGFPLHNRGAGFSFDAAHPNALKPGKRPFHTIIPAVVSHGDRHIGFGIMGGPNQPLAHAQFVSYLADYGMNLQAALEAPRFTKRAAEGCEVTVENRFGVEALTGLSALGHRLTIMREYTTAMGRGNAVMWDAASGVKYGASDPRTDGAAVPEP